MKFVKKLWVFMKEENILQSMATTMLLVALVSLLTITFAPYRLDGSYKLSSSRYSLLFFVVASTIIPIIVGVCVSVVAVIRRSMLVPTIIAYYESISIRIRQWLEQKSQA